MKPGDLPATYAELSKMMNIRPISSETVECDNEDEVLMFREPNRVSDRLTKSHIDLSSENDIDSAESESEHDTRESDHEMSDHQQSQVEHQDSLSSRGKRVKQQFDTLGSVMDTHVLLHSLMIRMNKIAVKGSQANTLNKNDSTAQMNSLANKINDVIGKIGFIDEHLVQKGSIFSEKSFANMCDGIRKARKPVLSYWHEKSRIARSLAILERPINEQIDQLISNADRMSSMIEDTHVPRFLGEHKPSEQSNTNGNCFDDSDFMHSTVSRHYGSVSFLPTSTCPSVRTYLSHKSKTKPGRLKTQKGKNVAFKVHSKIAGLCTRVQTSDKGIDRKAFLASLFSTPNPNTFLSSDNKY